MAMAAAAPPTAAARAVAAPIAGFAQRFAAPKPPPTSCSRLHEPRQNVTRDHSWQQYLDAVFSQERPPGAPHRARTMELELQLSDVSVKLRGSRQRNCDRAEEAAFLRQQRDLHWHPGYRRLLQELGRRSASTGAVRSSDVNLLQDLATCNEEVGAHRWTWQHVGDLVQAVAVTLARLVARGSAVSTPATATRRFSVWSASDAASVLGACAKLGYYDETICSQCLDAFVFNTDAVESCGVPDVRLGPLPGARRIDMVRMLLACGTLGHQMDSQQLSKLMLQSQRLFAPREDVQKDEVPAATGGPCGAARQIIIREESPRRFVQLAYALTLLRSSALPCGGGASSREDLSLEAGHLHALPSWLVNRLCNMSAIELRAVPEKRMLIPVLLLHGTVCEKMQKFRSLLLEDVGLGRELQRASDNTTHLSKFERNIKSFLTSAAVSFDVKTGTRSSSSYHFRFSYTPACRDLEKRWKSEHGVSVDFVLELNGGTDSPDAETGATKNAVFVAFEVDGPAHFCLQPGHERPLGRTLAKKEMLQRLSETCGAKNTCIPMSIPYFEIVDLNPACYQGDGAFSAEKLWNFVRRNLITQRLGK